MFWERQLLILNKTLDLQRDMVDETVNGIQYSIWASMNSWFTPTVLFVFLNLVIGTIAITSAVSSSNSKQSSQNESDRPKSNTNPASSVVHLLKSVGFYSRNQSVIQESPTQIFENHSDYLFAVEGEYSLSNSETHFVPRTEDPISVEDAVEKVEEIDAGPFSDEFPVKLPSKIRKSASLKSPAVHFAEDIVEIRRPATVRVNGNSKVFECDDEVDAKADDFINKFKQQLKLQRLDSVVKHKEMVGRSFEGGK